MLHNTTILPTTFTSTPEKSSSFYENSVRLLQNLLPSCLIFVDDREHIQKALIQEIEHWPVTQNKHKKKFKALMKKLRRQNRFVRISVELPSEIDSSQLSYQFCIQIAKEFSPLTVFSSRDYSTYAQQNLGNIAGIEIVNIEEYSISPVCDRLAKSDLLINRGEYDQDKFEKKILIPLFKTAKHVKIYDRYIGNVISQGTKAGKENSSSNQNKKNFKDALRWLYKVFLRESNRDKERTFEIYTGIKFDVSKDKGLLRKDERLKELRKFESEIKSNLRDLQLNTIPMIWLLLREICSMAGILFLRQSLKGDRPKLKIFAKKENLEKLPHDRYLVTDQFAISVGRGFNLFERQPTSYPRQIDDNNIKMCSDPWKATKAFRMPPHL